MKKKRSNCPASSESIYSKNIQEIFGHFPRQSIPGTALDFSRKPAEVRFIDAEKNQAYKHLKTKMVCEYTPLGDILSVLREIGAIYSVESPPTCTTAPSPWANPPQMEATPSPPPLLLNS